MIKYHIGIADYEKDSVTYKHGSVIKVLVYILPKLLTCKPTPLTITVTKVIQ